ncbi:MAG: hypothetical protein IPK62_06455 [Bacteroidetes bacterium]|nr:hypothetical protein [Bacteroidota bacterium]
MTTVIFVILSLLLVLYMISYYQDYKNVRLTVNRKTVLRNPIFIFAVYIFLTILTKTSEAIYYNVKYNPTDLIFNKNVERATHDMYPVTDAILSDKILYRSWKRYFKDKRYYATLHFVNADSIRTKLYYKFISIEEGKLKYESDHYKFAEGHLLSSYNYCTATHEYRYYNKTNQIDRLILKEEYNDTLKKWKEN